MILIYKPMTEKELREKYCNSTNDNNQNNQTIPLQNDKEIINQMAAMIEDPGNVNDIRINDTSAEEQTKFINSIKQLPRNQINHLLNKLGEANAINPNENEYHTSSKKSMARFYFNKFTQQQN